MMVTGETHGRMQVRLLAVAELFRADAIEPASVQRAFQWTGDHARVFLEDLTKAASRHAPPEPVQVENIEIAPSEELGGFPELDAPDVELVEGPDGYFLGPMVIHALSGEPETFIVFDGLQRITTLTILLAVLRDLLSVAGPSTDPVRDRLAACVTTPDSGPRLRARGDQNAMARFIQPAGAAVSLRRSFRNRPNARARILEIAADFRDRLKGEPQETLRSLASFLLDRVSVCAIDPGDAVMGRQIFVTINDRGLRLDQSDIFRSQLGLIMGEDEDGLDRLMARWRKVEERLPDIGQRQAFLQAADVLQRHQWADQRGLTDLGEHLIANHTAQSIFQWVDDLELQAASWQRLQRARAPDCADGLCDVLRRLHIFDWPEWHPLALFYIDRAQQAERENQLYRVGLAQTRLGELVDACMAITLAGLSAQVRQTVVRRALRDFRDQRNPLREGGPLRLLPDQRRRARETVSGPIYLPEIYRPFVRWLEASMWTDAPVPGWILATTTEHVLPRAVPPGSEWLRDFPHEDTRSAMAHRCGNLACLEWSLNEEADRRDFGPKKDVYARSEWMPRTLQRVLLTPRWDAATLTARSDEIAAFTIARLGLGEPVPGAVAG